MEWSHARSPPAVLGRDLRRRWGNRLRSLLAILLSEGKRAPLPHPLWQACSRTKSLPLSLPSVPLPALPPGFRPLGPSASPFRAKTTELFSLPPSPLGPCIGVCPQPRYPSGAARIPLTLRIKGRPEPQLQLQPATPSPLLSPPGNISRTRGCGGPPADAREGERRGGRESGGAWGGGQGFR